MATLCHQAFNVCVKEYRLESQQSLNPRVRVQRVACFVWDVFLQHTQLLQFTQHLRHNSTTTGKRQARTDWPLASIVPSLDRLLERFIGTNGEACIVSAPNGGDRGSIISEQIEYVSRQRSHRRDRHDGDTIFAKHEDKRAQGCQAPSRYRLR